MPVLSRWSFCGQEGRVVRYFDSCGVACRENISLESDATGPETAIFMGGRRAANYETGTELVYYLSPWKHYSAL